jgi:hypothetical protein
MSASDGGGCRIRALLNGQEMALEWVPISGSAASSRLVSAEFVRSMTSPPITLSQVKVQASSTTNGSRCNFGGAIMLKLERMG